MRDAAQQGEDLVRRAPSGYLWNQAYSLWLFLSLFLYQLVITRLLPVSEKGIYELVLTPANFAVYLAALGLESAGSVYLPNALAEDGPGAALAVALRLGALRLGAVLLVAGGILWGMPALAHLLLLLGLPEVAAFARNLGDPAVQAHRASLTAYVFATSLTNLLGALLTALLRTRIVFIAGGIAQLLAVGMAYLFVAPLHGGADGALYAMALPALLTTVIYAVALYRTLASRPRWAGARTTRPMLQFGVAAWLADLASGSLLKLIAVLQLGAVVASAQIAYFGLAYEMGHAAALLFVAGLGGVGLAVMAAAYAHRQLGHLAVAWRTVSKLQVVLAVPLVAFCVPQAGAIMRVLYGPRYAVAGPLLALFLALNAVVRVCGGGSHSAALYVLGRQSWVVITQWIALGVLALGDVLLIPRYGAAGALVAVGLAQIWTELSQLVLARRLLARPYPVGFMARVLLALVPALAFAWLWRPTTFVGLFFAGLGYAALFLLCLRLIRPLDAEDGLMLQSVARPLRLFLTPFVAPSRASGAPPTPPASEAEPSFATVSARAASAPSTGQR